MRLTFFYYTLFFAALTAALHLLAFHFALYWIFPWFDCMVHFFGGVMAACLTVAVLYPHIPQRTFIPYIIGIVLGVGIMWEAFEYTAGLSSHELNYLGDTLSDLSFDVLGGFLGGAMLQRILRKTHDHSSA